ncbi:sulfatase-like hydrolase/transferase [Haloarcula marina]|uniref:sulfatase-like hydrolase/transferase n=1 Tax=Haloarcula marina TaxID=2961574 RepID=UPI0020B8A7B1|nr:sulfatase-like hydrolase/transferase [Halomicroarcula marina]
MTSVALVVLDTLRKDSYDEFFDWMPGVQFDNAWSPCSWTVPAHGALFTGRYPSETGVYAQAEQLDYEGDVLAELLSEAGYTTSAFSANANISRPFQFDRGFDEFETTWKASRYDDDVVDWGTFISEHGTSGFGRYLYAVKELFGPDVDTLRSLRRGLKLKADDMGISTLTGDDDGAAQLRETLRNRSFDDEAFFFANLMEAHAPYDPPEEYRTTDVDYSPNIEDTISESGPAADHAGIRQAYDDSVRYLADVYRDVFAELRDAFDVVVTLSDHGEMFGEYGAWEHTHGIYPQLVHVPLSIYYDGVEDRRTDLPVSLCDVFTTVLAASGLDIDEYPGQDLLDDPEPRDLLVERHGLKAGHKHLLEERGYDEAVIDRYDTELWGSAQPVDYYGWETLDGFESVGRAERDDPRARLDDLRSGLERAAVVTGGEVDVPDHVADRLEELGYR